MAPCSTAHATVLSADPENRELLSRLQVLILIDVTNGHPLATKFWGPIVTSVFVSRLDPKPVLSAVRAALWLTAPASRCSLTGLYLSGFADSASAPRRKATAMLTAALDD